MYAIAKATLTNTKGQKRLDVGRMYVNHDLKCINPIIMKRFPMFLCEYMVDMTSPPLGGGEVAALPPPKGL